MPNNWFDEDPYLREQDALAEARGEVRGLQRVLITIVRNRFPSLTELAQEKAARYDKPDALLLLIGQVSTAPKEEFVRWLFDPTAVR